MLFKKKNEEKSDKAFDYGEKKEAMLLNMVTDTGLALTPEEKEEFRQSGWIDTGKFNGYGQPLVRDVKTGEILPVCRAYKPKNYSCNVYWEPKNINNNPCGILRG